MTGWRVTQLTYGTDAGRFHSHSYYDIPVLDDAGSRAIGYQTRFAERQPAPQNPVEIGLVSLDAPGDWQPLGVSTAWSWQQGPMAQWIAGRDAVVWNDRDPGGFVARLHDLTTGQTRTLAHPIYAVSPEGTCGLSLDMGRLETLRPGYGYAIDAAPDRLERIPATSGVWMTPLDGGAARLVLTLKDAQAWLMTLLPLRLRLLHRLRDYAYWFNHVKIAPGGKRFTVKLRWRVPGKGWNNKQGISLTADMTGGDLRLLADGTSHVIWQTDTTAYFWRDGELALFEDTFPRGRRIGQIGANMIDHNVHLRHLPPAPDADPSAYVFDTPYREDIELVRLDTANGTTDTIARFANHRPARGPFRCDLHPVPDATGDRILVTSMQDGGRQMYLVTRGAG